MDEQLQPTLIQNLIKELETSKDPQIRKIAAEKLGGQEYNSNPVLSALRTAIKFDPDDLVQEAARNSLEKLGVSVQHDDDRTQDSTLNSYNSWLKIILYIVWILFFLIKIYLTMASP